MNLHFKYGFPMYTIILEKKSLEMCRLICAVKKLIQIISLLQVHKIPFISSWILSQNSWKNLETKIFVKYPWHCDENLVSFHWFGSSFIHWILLYIFNVLNDVPGIYVQRSRRVFRENRKTYEARSGHLSQVLKDECIFPYRTGVQDGGRVRARSEDGQFWVVGRRWGRWWEQGMSSEV